MDDQIVGIYCLCDDFLQAMGHHEDPQCQKSDAEVMTTAIVASQFFGGNYESARGLLKQPQYIQNMLSKSRFCRRLHRVKGLFLTLFCLLGEVWKDLNTDSVYVIDTFPIPVWTIIVFLGQRFIRMKPTEVLSPARNATSTV